MKSLKAHALAGVKWTTLSAVICSVLQIVKMAILARLIAREDFGLFATIAVVLGFADFFVEAGLGSAVIHKQDATKEDLASAYTINIVLGWLIFIVLYYASWPVAAFYDESRLVSLLHLATLIFLIQPLGRQYNALLRRDLQFDILAKLDIFAASVGFVVSLLFAWQGLGVKALIYSQITVAFVSTVILMLIGCKKYGFNLGFSANSARFFFRFSMFQICENSVNYFNTQLDAILIGKLLGQETLGIFYMAKQIAFRPIQIINPIITTISLPVFAKVQNDTERLKRGYLQIVHSLAIIHFGLFTIMAGFAKEITSIFLGQNWSAAATILSILSFYTMLRAIGNPVGSLLIAKGRVDLGFYWNLSLLAYTPVIVIYTSKWGVLGISWGLLAAMAGLLIPGWYFLVHRLCGASFVEYFGKLFITLSIALLCFGPLIFMTHLSLKLITVFIGLFFYLWYNYQPIMALKRT